MLPKNFTIFLGKFAENAQPLRETMKSVSSTQICFNRNSDSEKVYHIQISTKFRIQASSNTISIREMNWNVINKSFKIVN